MFYPVFEAPFDSKQKTPTSHKGKSNWQGCKHGKKLTWNGRIVAWAVLGISARTMRWKVRCDLNRTTPSDFTPDLLSQPYEFRNTGRNSAVPSRYREFVRSITKRIIISIISAVASVSQQTPIQILIPITISVREFGGIVCLGLAATTRIKIQRRESHRRG